MKYSSPEVKTDPWLQMSNKLSSCAASSHYLQSSGQAAITVGQIRTKTSQEDRFIWHSGTFEFGSSRITSQYTRREPAEETLMMRFWSKPARKWTSVFVMSKSQRGINAYCTKLLMSHHLCVRMSHFHWQLKQIGDTVSFLLLPLNPSLSSRMFGPVFYMSRLGSERLLRQQAQADAEALSLQLRFLLR